MKVAAIYARVSTEEQSVSGISIDNQVERCFNYISTKDDWIINDEMIFIDDGFSGRSLHRPGYSALMNNKERWDVVIIWKLDRLHRSILNLLNMMTGITDIGKEVASVMENIDTTNAMGRFALGLFGLLAQLESEQISERVKSTMEFKAIHGEWISSPPYGYEMNDGLVEVDDEIAIVREVYKMRYLKKMSYQSIAMCLHDGGVPTKRGGLWSFNQVRRIINNVVYQGKIKYGKTIHRGNHRPIVPYKMSEGNEHYAYKLKIFLQCQDRKLPIDSEFRVEKKLFDLRIKSVLIEVVVSPDKNVIENRNRIAEKAGYNLIWLLSPGIDTYWYDENDVNFIKLSIEDDLMSRIDEKFGPIT